MIEKKKSLSNETESFVKGYRTGLNEAFELSIIEIENLLDSFVINHEVVNRLESIIKTLESYIVDR